MNFRTGSGYPFPCINHYYIQLLRIVDISSCVNCILYFSIFRHASLLWAEVLTIIACVRFGVFATADIYNISVSEVSHLESW